MMRGIHQDFEQQPAPAFFVRGPSPFARLTFFTALSLALMATDSRLQYLDNVRQNLMSLLQPLQTLASIPYDVYQSTDTYFSSHNFLLAENKHLKEQALVQSVNLQKLEALSLENENLRQLLQAQQSLTETSTLAEIDYIGRDAFSKKIIVNRGTNHQIIVGAAAVDATGVIGQVTRTYTASSEVTLITDKSLAIPVQVERNGLRAIAFGHGRDNTLDLPYLPANVDIDVGDRLVTSGIDGIYPAGLAVADVVEMKTSPDSPFARIVCKPSAGIENYRQILLVSTPKPTADAATVSKRAEQKIPSPAEKAITSAAKPDTQTNTAPNAAPSATPNTTGTTLETARAQH